MTIAESLQQGLQHHRAGRLHEAERIYRQVLQADPRQADALHLLGAIAHETGQSAQATALFRQAAALAPDNAVFRNALGEALLAAAQQEEALACFRQAVVLKPTYARAHNNLGRILLDRGDVAGAQASFEESIRVDKSYATGQNSLGAILQSQGQLQAAVTHFRQALALKPEYAEAHFNLGSTLQALGDPVSAVGHFRHAIRIRQEYVKAHFHLGQVLEQLRQDYDALACYETASRLKPDDSDIQRRLGDLLILKKDWPAALAALERAVALKPDSPEPFARLAYARQQVCEWRSYDADGDRLWADADKQMAAGEATAVVPFHALSLPWSRSRLLAIARSHCESMVRHQRQRGLQLGVEQSRQRTGRLRIGYLSGDFYDHAISHLLHGMFGRHDRNQFEVFAYSFAPPDTSAFRQRVIAECEHFVEVAALSIPALARRIAADGIHILVDLMGHTGVNRLGALALRPAPIQVSFLGMLGTMGADFVDYLIGDRIVTPKKFAASFTEKLVTMPDCYLVAEPAGPAFEADLERAGSSGRGELRRNNRLSEHSFVYCCFNSSYKIEPRSFAVWMRILKQVPESVLWLYSTGAFIEDNLRREAVAHGVAPERLVFSPFVGRDEHLVRQRAADLFLDTLLYNAAATASLALQAGLPMLTCPGDTFASRVGTSLLNALNMPELIAPDVERYERRAIDFARHPEVLKALTAKVVANRATAPLFDTPRFVRSLERAYLAMWEHFAAGRLAQPIEVPAT